MNMKEKMHSGDLYLPNDETIMAEQLLCLEKLYDFNATRPLELKKRASLLKEMFEVGGTPMEIANKGGMLMSNDTSEVESVADRILAENPKAVEEYKSGSAKVFGFLMGQMCRSLGRSANPAIVKKVLEEKLNS